MIHIWETSTTSGAGNLTLAGAKDSEAKTFTSAYDTEVRFYYHIKDSTAPAFEWGIGYLSASTTLVREVILETSSASFPSATALSLAGNTADVFVGAPSAGLISGISPSSPVAEGFVSEHIGAEPLGVTHSTDSNSIRFAPFKTSIPIPVNGMAVSVDTGDSGKARGGIYQWLPNRQPGKLLFEHDSDWDLSTAGTKTKAFAAAGYLMPGWYLLAMGTESGVNVTFDASRNYEIGSCPFGIDYTSSGHICLAAATITTGWTSLPDNPTIASILTGSSTNYPAWWID